MTPDDWKQVRAVFDAALERDAQARAAYLDGACSGKPWLRAEVMSLLDAHERTGELLERPAFEAGAALLADDPIESLEGRHIGPYLVRQEIGRGGMGVVYLAEDTRLARRVALKAIPPGVNHDPNRRERLRREARAAAALSHPGIATVYSLEEIAGELYLVSEYVPGHTLRTVLQAIPLSLPQVVDLATQLARALAAAHLSGVVHRDLKPENVIRTPAGVAKILDFGIARLESQAPSPLTQDGAVIGTPDHMAPEQIRGEHVDFRTDLFLFGLLIYEMASGANPFDAGTPSATMARILEHDPIPLSERVPPGSTQLDRIVASCMRKAPADRYQSAQELVADLEQLQADLSAERGRAAGAPRSEPVEPVRVTGRPTPQWWWAFHQIAVSVVYVLMIYPAWRARAWLPAPWAMVFLFGILACAAAATSLRLHLWFTARVLPSELASQRTRVLPWTRLSDAGFAAWLLLTAFTIENEHPEIATLFVTVSIAGAVASFLIEPATTRAAFNGFSGSRGSKGAKGSKGSGGLD